MTRDAREILTYDAGLLGDYGGGNVEWWQDYIRAELARAHDHYMEQFAAAIEKDRAEREAVVEAARDWIRDRETESAAFGSDADLKAFRRIERALPSPPSEETLS